MIEGEAPVGDSGHPEAPVGDSGHGERRRVELPGNRTLSVRPVRAADAPGLVALYASLDEEDLYRRFFAGHAPPPRFVEKMTRVEERGGFGVVAVMEDPDGAIRIVGEASFEPLPNGDAELGITVAADTRGWLGPYLVDTLVEEAAARGIPNLEADVLVGNRRMLSVLRSRGLAVMDHDEPPAVVRVAIGTAGRVPSWPGTHDRPRLLLEGSGGRWRADDAARAAGFQVVACPGPQRSGAHCPALRGEPCPLAAGADLIVDAVPGAPGGALLEAHRLLHPTVPVCVDLPAGDLGPPVPAAPLVPRGVDQAVVVGVLERLARSPAEAEERAGRPADDDRV